MMSNRPITLPPALAPLATEWRWTCWKWVEKNGKRNKEPFQGHNLSWHASLKKPTTWNALDVCLKAQAAGEMDGIMFALGKADSGYSDIAAIDIDDCRNKDSGSLHPLAAALINRAHTYVEITPSQQGLRIIGRAQGATIHRKFNVADGVSCELYRKADRFICVTGQQLGETQELADIDALLDELLVELETLKKKNTTNNNKDNGADKYDLVSLIKDGCGTDFGGDRSRAVWHVINQLLKRGDDPEAIIATITDPANGISAHCLDQSNPEAYARRQVEKAQQKQQERGDDADAELERLAKLSVLEYEHERKAAAEKLGVRAPMLDKLVAINRAELGLGGDDGLQGHAISFPEPEPWPAPVEGAELLDALSKTLGRHVVMAAHGLDLGGLWSVHTYLLDCFLISPRLCIRSAVKGCGKTTLLDVLACLVQRPLSAANVTAAVVFRVIEGHRPCLLADEADTWLPDNEELRGVLNAGHRRGGSVLRTVGDDHEPRAFSVYGAAAIALIGQLPGTLADRSVTIDLKRRLPSETIEPFRLDRTEHLDVLARKVVRWTQDNAEAVRAADPVMPEGIINREADNWRPLLAIAEVAGGEWPERARKAALQGREVDEADKRSVLELLLSDTRDIFRATDGLDKIASETLTNRLAALDGRPWPEFSRGKPLTQNKLARLYKPLGIAPQQIRFTADDSRKGYYFHQFEEAFDRYLPPEGGSEPKQRNKYDEMGTSDTFQTETATDDVSDAKSEKSNNDGQSFNVSDEKGGNGATTLDDTALGLLARRWANAVYDAEGRVIGNMKAADADLRSILATMLSPDRIEAEFARVMNLVAGGAQ
jgi:putative DNA primase/helicase